MLKNTKYLLTFALVWAIGSTYWYTCNIKYLCAAKSDTSAPKVTMDNTWTELKSKPLTVYFGPNTDNVLTEGVDQKLKDIVAYLQKNKSAKINITGHTNYHRNIPFTEKLGLDRANKLKALLVSYGASRESIATVSKGQRETVARYGDKNAENLNRRAIINIISE